MLDSRRCSALFAALFLFEAGLSTHAQSRANGYIDTSFSAKCGLGNANINFTTWAVLVLPDGRIMAGGNYITPLGTCQNGIVRLKTNGAVDTSFSSPLTPVSYVTGLATQSSGKVIISGQLSEGGLAFPVARLNSSGSIDGNFAHLLDPGLVGQAVLVQPDDKVIIAGAARVTNGFIARLNPNGSLDNSFANGTVLPEAGPSGLGINTLALQLGRVLVGGSFPAYYDGRRTLNRNGLARLNADGTLDPSFQAPLTNADVRALLVQPDGRILVGGNFRIHGGVTRSLVRLNLDSTYDDTFTPVGVGITTLSLAFEPDGKILVGHTLGFMRVTTNGMVDATFGPTNASGFYGTAGIYASAVATAPDGSVIVGATQLNVDSTERRAVVRLFDHLPPRPVIEQFSTNLTVDAGTNVTFSVMATGAPPLTYQWNKNGVPLSGATGTNLSLVDVNSTDTGNYTVIVSNFGGAVTSAVARLTVNFFVSPLLLTVNPANGGSVSPNYQGSVLEIGRDYTLTAKPAKGFLFTNWSGFETTANPVLTFTMQTNEVLQANFVPSPFIPVRGAYAGLFYDTNAPTHETAGAFALTLDDKGGFKGTVTMGKNKRKFSGTFSLDRVATVTIPATSKLPALALALELDTVSAFIDGTVTLGTNAPATLAAFLKVFTSKDRPAPNAGFYNAALPSTNDPALAPPGDGFVPLTITTAGRVSGKGALADGTAWSLVSATSLGAWVPVYVPLYSGAGSIFGWLTVTNTGANDVTGTLWWSKPGGLKGAINPAGITNRIDTLGSLFVAVAKGTPVLNLPDDVAILSYGNLVDSITNLISLGGDNKITGANGLNLSLSTAKGALTGSFVDPATAKKRTVKGVALPNQNQARGFFLGADEGGGVFVGD